jgi:CRP-like cAMP-binding protein
MTDTVRFKKGATIIHEGTTGSNAYLVLSGSVEVYKKVGDEKLVLSRLVKGNIFGEMSLVDDKPRSATIVALEDTEVRILSRERFESMLCRYPATQTGFSARQIFEPDGNGILWSSQHRDRGIGDSSSSAKGQN